MAVMVFLRISSSSLSSSPVRDVPFSSCRLRQEYGTAYARFTTFQLLPLSSVQASPRSVPTHTRPAESRSMAVITLDMKSSAPSSPARFHSP